MIKWFSKKLSCQRGEVGDDLESEAIQDATFTADVDDEGYIPPEGEEEPEKEQPPGEEPEKEPEPEKKPDKMFELETKLTEAQKEINRLGYALRKDKKESKKPEEAVFTKAQLMQLWKENADNPEVAFQILDEMTKLGKVDATLAAEKSADIKTKMNDMDAYLERMYPDAKKEGTELYEGIQKAIEWAHLDGHPLAAQLAVALLSFKNLPQTIENIKKTAKEEALKMSEKELAEKAEKARKKNIDASKPAGKGKSGDDLKAVSLSADQLDTLKRIVGQHPTKAQIARYSKMSGNKSGAMQSEE
uniref:Uncharacterized protein n=2 Tax=viral metagenome TaxID=1070528 RepID=A0A6M3JYL0_9ZZZZ